MTTLKDLKLKKVYSSNESNLLQEFYNPALECAVKYDRITGYFSPKVLALAARGISKMLHNGGRIRLITSIQVDDETFRALKESRLTIDSVASSSWQELEDSATLQKKLEKDYYTLFVVLLKEKIIDMRIAVTPTDTGILHEKIGIITDLEGKSLSFSGSNNETVYGWTRNIEEFKVFPSWDIATAEFYVHDKQKFEKYWSGQDESVQIFEVSDALKREILHTDRTYQLKEDIAEIVAETENQLSLERTSSKDLRDYQLEAIEFWRDNNYCSVFEMATGTGKTFTSINALADFRKNKGHLNCVVVVPLTTLVEQWKNDLSSVLSDIYTVTASGQNPNWRSDLRSIEFSRELDTTPDYIIVTTYSTFSSESFRDFIAGAKEPVVLVADEMHNIVTRAGLKSASSDSYKYKLGLSATPTRLWKQDESFTARQLFGGKSYVYSLEMALENKFLVPYNYYPIAVHLTAEEYEEYTALSKSISQLSTYQSDKEESSAYTMALTKRARIKKQAENKLYALSSLIKELRANATFNNTLIYADSNSYLQQVQQLLTENHIISTKFTGEESLGERLITIKNLREGKINAIVAIKCLDEGVDIPSARNGIFLANNTDPREYVQRLGRVLRRDDASDKVEANIYDYIVLPPISIDVNDTVGRNLVKGEFIRAIFFKNLSQNHTEVGEKLGEIVDLFNYYFESDELMYNQDNEVMYESY